MNKPLLEYTRLVGGTALALQYGHRSSVDLDFFGKIPNNEDLHFILSSIGNFQIISETKNIKSYFLDNIKIDFVNYQYPWLDYPIFEDGIRLASFKDIAAMKVNAIEGRGTKKDFVDMYFLLQHYNLNNILSFYEEKYPEHSIFRALMSMTYFEDAELQPMPKMFESINWEEIKKYICEQVERYK